MTDAMAPWAGRYIGLPFVEHGRNLAGADCWGLVTVIYREEAGIELPPFSGCYVSTAEHEHLESLIAKEREVLPFRTIAERLGESDRDYAVRLAGLVRPLDVLILKETGSLCHLGVAIGGGRFLHTMEGRGCIMSVFDPRMEKGERWAARLAAGGVWRHRSLEG